MKINVMGEKLMKGKLVFLHHIIFECIF